MNLDRSTKGLAREWLFLAILACGVIALVIVRSERTPEGHVYMKDGRFELNGEPYFPMVLNYIMNLQSDGDRIWASPYQGYEPGYGFAHFDRDSCLMQFRSDLLLIKEMGFNALRIVKLAEGPVRDHASGDLSLKVFKPDGKDTLLFLDQHVHEKQMQAVKDVLRIAEETGIKIILLTNLHAGERAWEENWQRTVSSLKDEKAILAFDLFNEPLYFDSLERTKEEVHAIVKGWRRSMEKFAPHHLFTIGLQGIREVPEWDPNILDVDFISFHPYEYEPDQVRNEMRWYHENVEVPWIIGETSLPADNDSVPYSDQSAFAEKVLRQARDCGACGFSWWQYKDVEWGEFHPGFMGVVSLDGSTTIEGAPLPISGTPKPVSHAIKAFDPKAAAGECLLLPNYANYSEHRVSMLTGRLIDEERRPIKGGFIIGWNEHWSHSYHTVSDENGYFELRGDMHFHHWMASATRYSHVRGDAYPNSYITKETGIPEFYLGELMLERLSFADR